MTDLTVVLDKLSSLEKSLEHISSVVENINGRVTDLEGRAGCNASAQILELTAASAASGAACVGRPPTEGEAAAG